MNAQERISLLKHRAYNMRVLSLKATTEAGSGHPTSALSAADLVAGLFFYAMHFDPSNPDNPSNDRFILSKGHAAPLLYAAWKEVGVLTDEEVLELRSFHSVLEGHPTSRFAYTEGATGSLGCGLSIGLGMALSSRLSRTRFYTYVLLGDSEMAEGSVWEACEVAAFYKTDNLIAIVDVNGLGQSTRTLDNYDLRKHEERWKAFGWYTICIDGHAMEQIVAALDEAKKQKGKPTVIIAKTVKGYGVATVENKQGHHGKVFSKEELPGILKQMEERFKEEASLRLEFPAVKRGERAKQDVSPISLPSAPYEKGAVLATRQAYGEALALLGEQSSDILSLDAEVKNSTFAEVFEKRYPDRFFQCFIAEQNMIGMAVGLTARHYIPFTSTFACFMTRAHDQIRMAAIGRSALRLAGSHAGVSIGQDGPSQMGLEDIALMRSLPDSIVLYPSEAVSAHALMGLMANYHEGISYIRLTRAKTPVLYDSAEPFFIGGCKVLKESDNDTVCIVAAGITVFEALKAYELLKAKNINVAVIDLYSIKPLDVDTLKSQALKANKRIITVEDHFIQGGLGEAVCAALRNEGITIEMLAVHEVSRSGKPEELLAYHNIDYNSLIGAVYKIMV